MEVVIIIREDISGVKRGDEIMAMTAKQEYEQEYDDNQKAVRNMVIQAIEQVKEGKTKDFDEVFDRLEKKYTRA